MSQPLLEASEGERDAQRELSLLRRANERLEQELREAKDALAEAKKESAGTLKAQAKLRQMAEPFYKVLGAAIGLLAEVVDEPTPGGTPYAPTLWTERIAKAPPSEGRVLRVLLDGGGPMFLQQIRIAAGTSSNTSTYLTRLIAKNWVQKTGHGSYALKEG